MNSNIIIQTLKSQLHGMKLQIDNIEIQNNNMMMGMNGTITEQLLNLSIQIINVGIQVFISEINKIINNNKYYDQLKVVSEQINSLVNSYGIQRQMMQQQMMQHDLFIKQMKVQNQNQFNVNEETEIKIKFNKGGSITEIKMKAGYMIAELLNEYYVKTSDNKGPFKYKGTILKLDDCSSLLDYGMQNGDEIIVG